MTNQRIGIYGGTFNPIHFGHLNLAIEIFEKAQLDEIWFIPAYLSPLKLDEPTLTSVDRLEMVKKAIKGIPFFKVLEIEIFVEGPSFTIDTLRKLEQKDKDFYLILGEDAAFRFDEWKEYEEILQRASPLIGSRSGVNFKQKISTLSFSSNVKEILLKGCVETDLFDISSTKIRERLKKGLYCGHLVPSKVLDYLYENQVYFSS